MYVVSIQISRGSRTRPIRRPRTHARIRDGPRDARVPGCWGCLLWGPPRALGAAWVGLCARGRGSTRRTEPPMMLGCTRSAPHAMLRPWLKRLH